MAPNNFAKFLLPAGSHISKIKRAISHQELSPRGGRVAKTVINAKDVLDDVRSGLSDDALMAKYNLSPGGLERLFAKLAELGALKRISATELLRDIRKGITNKELMEKYRLTRWSLKKVFTEMTQAGIAFFSEQSPKGERLRIKIGEISADIRSGMTETAIMEKYGLSSRGLQSTFWKLVHSGSLTWDELLAIYPNLEDSVTLQRIRKSTRNYPILSVTVYEDSNSQNRGKIRDLSDTGLGAVGISAEVGEKKRLILVPDELTDMAPFPLFAECRWFKPSGPGGLCSAGFEMMDIDEQSLATIHELVQLMTLTFE